MQCNYINLCDITNTHYLYHLYIPTGPGVDVGGVSEKLLKVNKNVKNKMNSFSLI